MRDHTALYELLVFIDSILVSIEYGLSEKLTYPVWKNII
jgi:hypothetical protein